MSYGCGSKIEEYHGISPPMDDGLTQHPPESQSWMEHGTYQGIMSKPAPNGRRHPRKFRGSKEKEQ